MGSTLSEERDGSGTVTKRFYNQGEQISGQQTAVLSGYGASYDYTFTVGFGLNNGLPSGTAAITLISPDLIVAPTTDLSSINQYPLGDFSRSLSLIFMENPIGDQGSGPLAEGSVTSYTVTYEAAPEPSACALASLGLMAVFFARRFTGRVYPPNR